MELNDIQSEDEEDCVDNVHRNNYEASLSIVRVNLSNIAIKTKQGLLSLYERIAIKSLTETNAKEGKWELKLNEPNIKV